MKKSVALVYNPAAGSGRRRPSAERVREALQETGAEVEIFTTRGPGDGVVQGQRAAERHPFVAVYGGDGAVNEALNGVVASGRSPAVLLLAGGTMNVLLRDLKIPLNALRAAKLLENGIPRRIYLGSAVYDGCAGWPGGRRYFTLMAGAGFDGSIIYGMASRGGAKKALGPWAFALEGLRQLRTYNFPEIQVVSDDGDRRGYGVVVGKSRGYGGWFSVTSNADATRPGFQVALSTERTMARYPYYMALALAGSLEKSRDHLFFPATRLGLSSKEEVRVQIDGESVGTLPMEFVSDDTSVQVLTPACS